MSRTDSRPGLTPSLIDRLIDPDSGPSSWQPGYGFDQMVATVRRDLEELLNVQLVPDEVPDAFPEVRRSVACFGVPELVSLEGDASRIGREVARSIREAIERFEPRLRDVRVSILDSPERRPERLQFQITATLRISPAPEVSFVTVLKLTTGQASVERRTGSP